MHPAAVIALAAAAKGFGEGFGKELGQRLFGGGSSDLKAIQKQLAEIISRLKVIEAKLDQVIMAVQQLPQVIIGQYRQELVDEAYRQLEAYYEILRTADSDVLNPPELADRAMVLKCWYTVVDLEDRTRLLLDLPFLTEFVRKLLVAPIDHSLRTRLAAKVARLEGLKDRYARSLNVLFEQSELLLSEGHFDNTAVKGAAPYFSYKVKSAPMIQVWVREHCTTPYRISKPDPQWGSKVAAQEAKLQVITAEIDAEARRYEAAHAAWALLHEYVAHLNRGGDMAADLVSEVEVLELVPERNPLLGCD